MNALGTMFAWWALQATVFAVVGVIIYAICRRRGPAAGAAVAAATMLLMLIVGLLAFSPWPHWWSLSMTEPVAIGAQRSRPADPSSGGGHGAAAGASRVEVESAHRERPSAAETDEVSVASAFWAALSRALQEPPPHVARRQWPTIVGLLLVTGMGLALTRLLAGLALVYRYRVTSTVVEDEPMIDQLEVLRAQLSCRSRIELCQSSRIASPATVGWWRPLILLPSDWRQWSDEERRVVLAHEVAHVQRQDYLVWLLAQLSTAMYFYHPLVYWLAARLRIDQEMAADTQGALVSGGRQLYLQTLARMALRQDSGRISWAARPFLPAYGTFVRRIEMLRHCKQLRVDRVSTAGRLIVIGVLAVTAVLIAGVRGPDRSLRAQVVEREGQPPRTDVGTDSLSFVPAAPLAVAQLQPEGFLSRPSSGPLAQMLRDDLKLDQRLGIPASQLSSVLLVMSKAPEGRSEWPFSRAILRSKVDHDWNSLITQLIREPAKVAFAGQSFFQPARAVNGEGPAALVADGRTLVIASSAAEMREMLVDSRESRNHDWRSRWEAIATGDIALMVDMRQVRRLVARNSVAVPQQTPQGALLTTLGVLAPLWDEADHLYVGINQQAALGLTATFTSTQPESAEKVQQTLTALLTLARNGIATARQRLAAAPEQERAVITMLLSAGEDLIEHAQVVRQQNDVRLTSTSAMGAVPTLAAVVLPAVAQARDAARRAQSSNNLKQIALAMHNYYDTHKRLPTAVIIGPDGKTPHSWRVALLPYLDQLALYQQYRLDEPWDSENNKRVLAQIPNVYRHPADEPTSTSTSYFVLTGRGTLFSEKDGMTFAQVRDGTSNTILAITAKRDIPWTKPEDIQYDPNNPLPMLGGWLDEKRLEFALADGSVRNPPPLDEATLRALISPAGGEVIPDF